MATYEVGQGACGPGDRRRPSGAASRARAAGVFRALADPTRLEVFALIAARPEPICVCDIVAKFDVSQPTISHHLRVLRKAGLVAATRRGTWSYYAVDERGVTAARAAIAVVLTEGSHVTD
jgi:ArsR family transcriptional regulator